LPENRFARFLETCLPAHSERKLGLMLATVRVRVRVRLRDKWGLGHKVGLDVRLLFLSSNLVLF
jgi:hypothetical protein